MSNRLTLSVILVAISVVLVWAFRPEQGGVERMDSSGIRQPTSVQPVIDAE